MWSVGLLYLEDVPWMGQGGEYDQHTALETTCGSVDGFAQRLQNSW